MSAIHVNGRTGQDVAAIDGATLSEHALALHWFDADHCGRLLLVASARSAVSNPRPEEAK